MPDDRPYVDPRGAGHRRWTLKAQGDRWIVWNAPPVMDEDAGRKLELQPGVEREARSIKIPASLFAAVEARAAKFGISSEAWIADACEFVLAEAGVDLTPRLAPDARTVHCAVVIDYDRGAVTPGDVEQAIEEGLGWVGPERGVKAKVVFVSERLHGRLLDAAEPEPTRPDPGETGGP